jgi:4-amino-4-deoxy-L-arabinose transferase-like glycosyltransferase
MSTAVGLSRIDAYLPTGTRLFVWLERESAAHPQRLFWCFVVLHAAIWAAAGSLLQYTQTADNFEMAAWGREWQWGYWKHPPLPAWALEAAIVLTGQAHWTPYVLSQLFVALTFWGIWKLAREIVDERRALLAVIFLAGVSAFDYEAFRFNHNISSLPWRALVAWSFYRGLVHGRMTDWVLLGVWMAIGMFAKYDILFMLVPLGVLAVVHPQTRKFIATPGPYIAVAVALVLLSPHIAWRVENNFFGAIDAPSGRMGGGALGVLGHLWYPIDFALNVAFMILPAIIMALALRGHWRPAPAPITGGSFARWYVALAALSPVGVAIATSAVSGLRLPEAWAVPMLDFVGLFAVVFFAGQFDGAGLRRFFAAAMVATVAVLAGTTWHSFVVEPYFQGNPGSSRMPGQELVDALMEPWNAATGSATLRYAVGPHDYAGRISYYWSGRPSLFENADLTRSPWVDTAELARRGALAIWPVRNENTPAPRWLTTLPPSDIQPMLTLQAHIWGPAATMRYRWAIIRPAPQ